MRKLLCVTVMALVAGCAAQADVFYSDFASWNASLTGVTTINFEGIAAPGNPVFYPGFTTIGGVNFAIGPAGIGNLLAVEGDGGQFAPSVITAQVTDGSPGAPPNDLLITLPNPVTALGFDFGSFFVGDNATITLSDGSVQTVVAPTNPNLTFFGVIAPGGITSVDITIPSDSFGIGVADFSYAPEPSLLLLLSVGLAGVIGIAYRRQRTN